MLMIPLAPADSIEFRSDVRRVTALEASDGAPAGGIVYQHYVTTDADILSINSVETDVISGTIYDHPLSQPGEAPHPGFFDFFPSMSADSYVTSPGETIVLGGGLPADGEVTFGDVSDEGPQADFLFAQLTFPDGGGVSFSGRVSIAGSGGVFSAPFSFLDFPIVQHAYLDSYPTDGSEVAVDRALAASSGIFSDAIVLSADGPGGGPFEVLQVTVSNDLHGIFSAAANGWNIDVGIDRQAARQLPSGTQASADLKVETNSGDLSFTLTALVPEPTSGCVLLLGIGCTAGIGRRRKV